MKPELTHPTEDGLENAAAEAVTKQRRYIERLDHRIHLLDNQIDSLTPLYLQPPPALRSPVLRHELLALVGQRARLAVEIARAKVKAP